MVNQINLFDRINLTELVLFDKSGKELGKLEELIGILHKFELACEKKKKQKRVNPEIDFKFSIFLKTIIIDAVYNPDPCAQFPITTMDHILTRKGSHYYHQITNIRDLTRILYNIDTMNSIHKSNSVKNLFEVEPVKFQSMFVSGKSSEFMKHVLNFKINDSLIELTPEFLDKLSKLNNFLDYFFISHQINTSTIYLIITSNLPIPFCEIFSDFMSQQIDTGLMIKITPSSLMKTNFIIIDDQLHAMLKSLIK